MHCSAQTQIHRLGKHFTTIDRANNLGVLFTPDLKFSLHIKLITRKANSVIGNIKHTFSCLDRTMFRTLY